ncbi:MAG TPA: alpha/beta hydrolase [Candidatus Binataceae bacterium]|nr:alpha/beta hydrolase [Candidatus Binataceae bacterium]
MSAFNHRFVETNGIRMHFAEAGAGPLVVLCHGFPESWYSWRHQLAALAAAGFHAVAPDQRGYGETDKPEAVDAYSVLHLAGDIVGLVNALGERSAAIVGHDWGAPVAWYSALLRPDLFRAVGLLSVPYIPRGPMRPSAIVKAVFAGRMFYQEYFQQEGVAERELERDARASLLGMFYSLSGDAAPNERWRYAFGPDETFLDSLVVPRALPTWLSEADLEFFTGEFKRSGFRGALNWYRNIDRGWELTGFLDGARLAQPTLFIAGEKDAVIEFYADACGALKNNAPNLAAQVVLPGAGHWIQQERPAEVNRILVDFLRSL